MQSVFVCVCTPKQTFELIYIRLKPQAHSKLDIIDVNPSINILESSVGPRSLNLQLPMYDMSTIFVDGRQK